MVVKTRTSLPIDLYCDAKDYETLLPDIYNGENSVLGLTQQRVRNLVSQMKEWALFVCLSGRLIDLIEYKSP